MLALWDYTLWDVKLCGEHLTDWRSKCFQLLIFICPTLFLLTFTSAYYIGKHVCRLVCRSKYQVVLINIRIFICVFLLLCLPVRVIILYKYSHLDFQIIDYVSFFLSFFCWIIHIKYLCVLKTGLTLHTRGPILVLLAFILNVMASAFYLGVIVKYYHVDFQLKMEKYFVIFIVVVHLLYIVTLLPKGQSREWQYEEFRNINTFAQEREPLSLSASVRYGAFHEETEPNALGTAEDCGIISKLFLCWILPLMKKGYMNLIQTVDDLFDLPLTLQASYLDSKFIGVKDSGHDDNYILSSSAADAESKFNLLKRFHQCFGSEYYFIGLLKLMSDALSFAGPLLLNLLVSFFESKPKSDDYIGYYYAIGLLCTTTVGALCSTHYGYLVSRIGLKVRASVIISIYCKTLEINKVSISTYSTGEIVNFMSTDTDRIVNFCQSFHQFWSLPIQVIFTLYFLHNQIGYSYLVGLVFALLIIPLNQYIARKIGIYSKFMMTEKDKRIKLVNEILTGIKVVKMHAWEAIFSKKIHLIRQEEIKYLKRRKYLDAFCVYFWATTPVVISFLTFTTYVLLGNELTASKVFTSIALFNMLIMPLNAFPWVLNGLMEAAVSLKRVQKFLQLPEFHVNSYYDEPNDEMTELEICNGVFKYFSLSPVEPVNNEVSADYGNVFTLGPVDMKLLRGKLVCVIGKVGSGKSTLLSSILGDVTRVSGSVYLSYKNRKQGIGYVSQEPWIQQTSIKNNVLFGKALNAIKYRKVLEACALFDDLKILPFGDRTEVGDRGITLSGGQKARIAIARAVYQDAEIYLMDDPLSAVDVHVAEHIFSNCIVGLLKNKTRILCTHNMQFIEKADSVILLLNGKVLLQGLPSNIPLLHFLQSKKEHIDDSVECTLQNAELGKDLNEGSERLDNLVLEEERDEGVVKFDVYKMYWNSIGSSLAVFVLLACFFMQATRTVSDWWLSYWITNTANNSSNTVYNVSNIYNNETVLRFLEAESNKANSISFYLYVYAGLAAANSCFTIIRSFLYAYCGIKAAVVLHDKLFKTIMKATIGFFDVTPLGRILNRFSSDIYNIDDSLPFTLNILLAQTFSLFGCLAVTCYCLPWIGILIIPLCLVYYKIQNYYRCTSRELKRLCTVTLSPLYAHFSETLNGQSSIRAFSSTTRFMRENMEKLDANQKAMFAVMISSQWLNLRLQFIGVIVISGVSLIALLQNQFHYVNPGLVGLALSYALSITSLLSGAVTAFTETEKESVSVERVKQYIENVNLEKDTELVQPPFSWPSHGVITFENVFLQYREECPFALKNVTFETKPAEKIGILGRTGSGKSSLIQVLFRMIEIAHGRILIDGVNIANLSLQKLRLHLSVIPQDPFLFSGTVRENLDPNNNHTDSEIWRAISNCHIEKKIYSIGGLDAEIEEKGRNFSAGERQLLCLARMLLYKARILCMDEATSSTDRQTDCLIQHTIRMAFRHTTVLIIAHRVETIMDCDRVLIMSNGEIIEIGKPAVLLTDNNSEFYKIVYGIK